MSGKGSILDIGIRPAVIADADECARINYEAFTAVAADHNFPSDFDSFEAAKAVWSSLQESPGFHGMVAECNGEIVGSNFLDERSAVKSIGPIAVDPGTEGKHIGQALMTAALNRARHQRAAGVRLMQVGYNSRSLSLYTKLGFTVRDSFATVYGPPIKEAVPGYDVRDACGADIDACKALCMEVHGYERAAELYEALDGNTASVVERNGRITGYTTGIGFLGHSVAKSNEDLIALISSAPQFGKPGFFVPLQNAALLAWVIEHQLRVVYTMNLMTIGQYQSPRGAYLPSLRC